MMLSFPKTGETARASGLSRSGLNHSISGSGPGLVLLHEMGGSLESFDALTARLAPRFRILRYDQRGAGGSAPAPLGMGIADHASDLVGLLAETGFGPVHAVLGVAAGAAIAVTHAAQGGDTGALILCAPALSVPEDRRAYLEARSDLARRDGMTAVTEASLARSWPEWLRTDADTFARYRARFLANDPQAYADANMALADSSAPDLLPHLAQPCLVVAGRHDLLRPPAEVLQTAARIPHARYAEIESGHLMSVQAPEALATAILGFLEPGQTRRNPPDR